jgi:hypothetical protein
MGNVNMNGTEKIPSNVETSDVRTASVELLVNAQRATIAIVITKFSLEFATQEWQHRSCIATPHAIPRAENGA